MSIVYTCLFLLTLSTTVRDVAGRMCTIRIVNKCTTHRLTNPRTYTWSGSSPRFYYEIPPNYSSTVHYYKTPHTARGVVGVFTYELQGVTSRHRDRTFALMFSVPFDYNLHDNWYAAGLRVNPTYNYYDLYQSMYYGEDLAWFDRGKAGNYLYYRDGRFTITASMRGTIRPTIEVTLYDDWH